MKAITSFRKLLLLFFVLSFLGIKAVPAPDSLWIAWNNDAIPQATRILQIHKIYQRHYLLNGADSTLEFTRQLSEKARWSSDQRYYVIALEVHGLSNLNMNQPEQAIEYFSLSLEKAIEIKFSEYKLINCLNLGKAYTVVGNYSEAMHHYSRVIQLCTDIGSGLIDENQRSGQSNNLSTTTGILDFQREAADGLYQASMLFDNERKERDFPVSPFHSDSVLKLEKAENRLKQIEFSEQRKADSLAMNEKRLIAEFNYQKSIQKEKNTTTIFMFIGFGILIISGGLFSRIRYIRRTNKKLKEKNRVIAIEKEKTEKSEQFKDQFFANISHEFRTPLTLILGPLRNVAERVNQMEIKKELGIIERNSLQLQKLVDQLLSLSKIDSGKMKMNVGEEDIVQALKGFTSPFKLLAKQKNVKLKFLSEAKEPGVFFDHQKIECVFNNLLSNAFKFVHSNGQISVKLHPYSDSETTQEGIRVTVANTGRVIPGEWHDHIFDRFSQVDGYDQIGFEGTGIGLALSKDLVKLHHGRIWVDPEYEQGASFSFFLPYGSSHFLNEDIVSQQRNKLETDTVNDKLIPSLVLSELDQPDAISENPETNSDLPILLIVEDNRDMVSYIKGFFETEYNVLYAENGVDGLRKAIEIVPDIIISDVMMPKMDGHKMCEKIKEDERTSHIPVILLTAKATMECKIESLETGADDFMVKPFNAEELKIRVRNLIEQRSQLKKVLKHHLGDYHSIKLLNVSGRGITSMDEDFLNKAVNVVDEHLSNPDFSVLEFSKCMNMHRVQLHRKLKALTGQSGSDMIRSVRLKRAAELFKKQAGHVTQIAYDVGFSNLSYFAKAFKAEYKLSPSDYIKKNA